MENWCARYRPSLADPAFVARFRFGCNRRHSRQSAVEGWRNVIIEQRGLQTRGDPVTQRAGPGSAPRTGSAGEPSQGDRHVEEPARREPGPEVPHPGHQHLDHGHPESGRVWSRTSSSMPAPRRGPSRPGRRPADRRAGCSRQLAGDRVGRAGSGARYGLVGGRRVPPPASGSGSVGSAYPGRRRGPRPRRAAVGPSPSGPGAAPRRGSKCAPKPKIMSWAACRYAPRAPPPRGCRGPW